MKIDLSKNIYDLMVSHQFVMSVVGNVNQDILKSLMKATERKLNNLETDRQTKKRIFHFMIECAQNICQKDLNPSNNKLFLIGKLGKDYIVYLASVFKTEQVNRITGTIDQINELNSGEVKERFYSELLSKSIDEQDKLLLSLLDITKRSKEKIGYELKTLDQDNSFLSLKSLIEI